MKWSRDWFIKGPTERKKSWHSLPPSTSWNKYLTLLLFVHIHWNFIHHHKNIKPDICWPTSWMTSAVRLMPTQRPIVLLQMKNTPIAQHPIICRSTTESISYICSSVINTPTFFHKGPLELILKVICSVCVWLPSSLICAHTAAEGSSPDELARSRQQTCWLWSQGSICVSRLSLGL